LKHPRITVLLISDSPSTAEEVRRWLSVPDQVVEFVFNWVDSIAAAIVRLAQGGLDFILLELPIGDADPLQTIATIRPLAPQTAVVALIVKAKISLVEQLVALGADECVIKDIIEADEFESNSLRRLIKHAVEDYGHRKRREAQKPTPERARVVGVIGASGGAGTTTVACTLAAELRQQTNQRTVLGDLDLNAGMVSFLMGIAPKYSLSDIIANLDRLDVSLWEKFVAPGPDGVDIVSSPSFFGRGEVKTESLLRLLGLLYPVYHWMVADLGRINATVLPLLDKMDDLIVVTSVGVCALHQSKRLLAVLANAHLEKTHIHLVVNSLLHHSPLSQRELTIAFGMPIYASLPTDLEALDKASTDRTLPAADSRFRKQVAHLARSLAGLPEAESEGPLARFRRYFGNEHKAAESIPSELVK
jgi:Flp pilus assembly CpaE family ATPase